MFEEWKLKRKIMKEAKKAANISYEKDFMFRKLQSTDLNYAIIQDIMRSVDFAGKCTVEMKDGTKIIVEPKQDRTKLNELYEDQF